MTLSTPDNAVDLGPGVWADPADLHYTFVRSGGPGGQAVNKLATKAELRIAVTAICGLSEAATRRLRKLAGRRLTQEDELVITASTARSQLDNRRACLERLRKLVGDAVRAPKPRKKTKPTRAAREKRLAEKRRRGEKKKRRRKPEEEKE